MASNDNDVICAQRDLRAINNRRAMLRRAMKDADEKAQAQLAIVAKCTHRVSPDGGRPRGTTLCMEIAYGTPAARCRQKPPSSWAGCDPNGARWLLSGGSPLVFGECDNNCPLLKLKETDDHDN